ncbi:hypothetical protein EJ06DRAFT_525573 [Trichodelitschia bisporula]|uniref:Uncharacterized protein n=1 Tax=Trichodelitschia bisporula TaxID=703511 RepID=A0A6G1IAI2_9PEZI|nr:hypothetical protein EJ06DRAFT_525573 [Trichodelitschia bisporula]
MSQDLFAAFANDLNLQPSSTPPTASKSGSTHKYPLSAFDSIASNPCPSTSHQQKLIDGFPTPEKKKDAKAAIADDDDWGDWSAPAAPVATTTARNLGSSSVQKDSDVLFDADAEATDEDDDFGDFVGENPDPVTIKKQDVSKDPFDAFKGTEFKPQTPQGKGKQPTSDFGDLLDFDNHGFRPSDAEPAKSSFSAASSEMISDPWPTQPYTASVSNQLSLNVAQEDNVSASSASKAGGAPSPSMPTPHAGTASRPGIIKIPTDVFLQTVTNPAGFIFLPDKLKSKPKVEQSSSIWDIDEPTSNTSTAALRAAPVPNTQSPHVTSGPWALPLSVPANRPSEPRTTENAPPKDLDTAPEPTSRLPQTTQGGTLDDVDDWGDWDSPEPSKKDLQALENFVSPLSKPDPRLRTGPPTDIPPPGQILSIFPPLLASIQDKFLRQVATLSPDGRDEAYSSEITLHYIIGYLELVRVCARIVTGREFRWHRDTHLQNNMRVGPAGRSQNSMKLMNIARPERELQDAMAQSCIEEWTELVGKVRAAVLLLKKHGFKQKAELAVPPKLDAKFSKSFNGEVERDVCGLCGLHRTERLERIDMDDFDGFGEWWREDLSMHRTCGKFYEENRAAMMRG